MPKFLEDRLKAEYGADSAIPFKVMNAIGAMHGNKETPKGAAMQAKHDVKINPVRTLHPALAAHGQKVKAAHAHLSSSVPGFHKLPLPAQGRATQQHIRQMGRK